MRRGGVGLSPRAPVLSSSAMRGVITRVQVLAHPRVIVESFGLKVLVRALFANARDTFLEIVSACAEEEEHANQHDLPLARTVKRFIEFEHRLGELYRRLSLQFPRVPDAAKFLTTLSSEEEAHAILLARVHREIRRGHLWKDSKDVYDAIVEAFGVRLEGYEEEVRRGVTLARALDVVEAIEASEINVVFDSLNGSVDMRSRPRFERFLGLTQDHVEFCGGRIAALRERYGIALATG